MAGVGPGGTAEGRCGQLEDTGVDSGLVGPTGWAYRANGREVGGLDRLVAPKVGKQDGKAHRGRPHPGECMLPLSQSCCSP